MELPGTKDESYQAVTVARTSIANVAAICEGLAKGMLRTFPPRFHVPEGSKVLTMESGRSPLVMCDGGQVECKRVVICTNGYALPDLTGTLNFLPDGYLKCVTGFMNGYRPSKKGEKVGLFFQEVQPSADEPYVFTTTWRNDPGTAILMVGWPQFNCEGDRRRDVLDEIAHSRIDNLASEILRIDTKAIAHWDAPMASPAQE